MVKVKICGIKSLTDALWAANCGADILGFNFVKKTPRFIPPESAFSIIKELPPFVFLTGIFADEDLDSIERISKFCSLNFVQLHGRESPEFCSRIKKAGVIKAIRIGADEDLDKMAGYKVAAYLIDAKVNGRLGGTGMRIPPPLARRACLKVPAILAGGLTPDNVEAAIKYVRPYAVDVCSGVETSPGIKSKKLVKEFIIKAKSVQT